MGFFYLMLLTMSLSDDSSSLFINLMSKIVSKMTEMQKTPISVPLSPPLDRLKISVESTPSPPLAVDETESLLADPNSDYDNPRAIKFEEISAAAFMIQSGIIHTPTMMSHLSDGLDMEIYLKKEFLQHTGSFKERGARYAMMKLSAEQKRIGVISASAGNHALGLAYHGKKLNIPVTVVCPIFAPLMKIQQCKAFGANVIVHGENFDESKAHALKLSKKRGQLYINGYDHPDIIAGQGTTGLEICRDVPDFDAVLVSVGGGGLIAGISLAIKTLKPNVEVIGIESENCPGFTESLKAGRPVKVGNKSSLADGLGVAHIGPNSFATAKRYVDRMVTVSEDYIALAILRMVEMEKAVVEGAGAVGIAALLQNKLPHLRGKKVVCVLSGGNIDTSILGRCLDRGLAADGRLMRIGIVVSDRPGGIAELADLLAKNRGCVRDIFHERAWVRGDVFAVKITVILETRDLEHSRHIMMVLREKYQTVDSTIESSAVIQAGNC